MEQKVIPYIANFNIHVHIHAYTNTFGTHKRACTDINASITQEIAFEDNELI